MSYCGEELPFSGYRILAGEGFLIGSQRPTPDLRGRPAKGNQQQFRTFTTFRHSYSTCQLQASMFRRTEIHRGVDNRNSPRPFRITSPSGDRATRRGSTALTEQHGTPRPATTERRPIHHQDRGRPNTLSRASYRSAFRPARCCPASN
jgi:hypothetical protein